MLKIITKYYIVAVNYGKNYSYEQGRTNIQHHSILKNYVNSRKIFKYNQYIMIIF